MAGIRFDELARSLTTAGSRRRALALALSGALASVVAREDAAAHDLKAKCKKKSGQAKKKCLKKAKAHNAQHAAETPPPGPTCSDGTRNGAETDVDCGGPSCPRCATGQLCITRDDCATALCASHVCQECTSTGQCEGDCECLLGASRQCAQGPFYRRSCDDCPADAVCDHVDVDPDVFECWPLCGATEVCGGADACQTDLAHCGNGGDCLQPLGGGPTRCGTPVTASCGCTSHQQCADTHGTGAFCVQFASTSTSCSCGGATTFCATPR